jgi:hypothetical protein
MSNYICRFCGQDCHSGAGLESHEKSHKHQSLVSRGSTHDWKVALNVDGKNKRRL